MCATGWAQGAPGVRDPLGARAADARPGEPDDATQSRRAFTERIRSQVDEEIGKQAVESARCDEAVHEAIRALGAPSFAERELASAALRSSPLTSAQILAGLRHAEWMPTWDAETRARALAVILDRILLAPRGALGVSMDPATIGNRPGVTIQEVIEGLPAEGVLREGDRLFEIDGAAVTSNEECIDAIQSHRPGEAIRVKVGRPKRGANGRALVDPAGLPLEEILEFTMELGRDDQLDAANRARPRRSLQNFGAERRRAVRELLRDWMVDGECVTPRDPLVRSPIGKQGLSESERPTTRERQE